MLSALKVINVSLYWIGCYENATVITRLIYRTYSPGWLHWSTAQLDWHLCNPSRPVSNISDAAACSFSNQNIQDNFVFLFALST